jgi:hypothetical protein
MKNLNNEEEMRANLPDYCDYEGKVDLKKFEAADRNKAIIRTMIAEYGDLQKIRIATGNRFVQIIKTQAGVKPSVKMDADTDGDATDEVDKEIVKMLQSLKKEYNRITDACIANEVTISKLLKNNMTDNQLELKYLTDVTYYNQMKLYTNLCEQEEQQKKSIESMLKGIPIYDEFLSKQKGVGPIMAGYIIAYFDIYKAKYVSSFFKYAGIDCVYDPEKDKYVGRTMKYTEEREYIDKFGNVKTKKSLTYSPILKAKLMGVLSESFIKTKSDWAVPYYEYKNRKLQANNILKTEYDTKIETIKEMIDNCSDDGQLHVLNDTLNTVEAEKKKNVKTLTHIDAMAKRYAVKQFLHELFDKWKELEGLPIPPRYEVVKLGLAPHHWDPYDKFREDHPDYFKKKDTKEISSDDEKPKKRGRKKKVVESTEA